MAIKGQSITISYFAWDTSANAYKTGDVANHTLRVMKDGTDAATTNSPAEVSAANRPGEYKLTLTATEMTANVVKVFGKSSTANIVLVGFSDIVTEQGVLPGGTTAGAAGGVFIAGSNAATTVNFTGNLSGSVGSVTAAVTVGTNNDKTGYALTQAFPANFAATLITAGGHISNVDTLTTYTGNTPQTGDLFARYTAAITESYAAKGSQFTMEQFACLITAYLTNLSISGTTFTAHNLAGGTAATGTLDSATNPTQNLRAT